MPTSFNEKRVPRYIQIIDFIQGNITDGLWGPHHKIPSEDELAHQFSYARGTVRQAINELVNSNALYRIHGKGTFVGPQVLQHEVSTTRFRSFLDEFLDKKIDFETKQLQCSVMPVPPKVNEYLKLASPSDKVLEVCRLRSTGGESIMYSENHVPLALFPGIEAMDFSKKGIYTTMEDVFGISLGWSQRYFEAVKAENHIARLLEVEPGSPVMLAQQIVYDHKGTCVDCAFIWLRSDKLRISINTEKHLHAED